MSVIKLISVSLLLLLFFNFQLSAQEDIKIVAVINHAKWCGVCVRHTDRAMEAFNANNKEGIIYFISNDLTNQETRKKGQEEISKFGLDEAMSNWKATGFAYFFDLETKKTVRLISVQKTNEQIAREIKNIIKDYKL